MCFLGNYSNRRLPLVKSHASATFALAVTGILSILIAAPLLAQNDPTSDQPVLIEPRVVIPSLKGGRHTIRAIYDDRVHHRVVRDADGTKRIVRETTITHSYNRQFPGETIYIDPGATLNFRLENHLSFTGASVTNTTPPVLGNNDSKEVRDFIIGQRNKTNLHTHGLHVSPLGYADNVMLIVNTNRGVEYKYEIPTNHAPGTHWYHSHLHGSTGLQVTRGMLGALIVTEPFGQNLTPTQYLSDVQERLLILRQESGGGIDETPEEGIETRLAQEIQKSTAASAEEKRKNRLAIQQLVNAQSESDIRNLAGGPEGRQRLANALKQLNQDRDDAVFTVNGQLNPVLELVPGDIVRFRIVNAGANGGDYKEVYVENHDLYLAAFDGVNLTQLPKDSNDKFVAYNKDNPLKLAPSNRADIYFVADDVGEYEFKSIRYTRRGGSARPVESTLFDIEISNATFRGKDELDQAAYDKQVDEFLVALDANLKRLQGIGAYSEGEYLHDITDATIDAKRTVEFNVDNRSFTINKRDFNALDDKGHMKGHADYLGLNKGDGGVSPTGISPWPIRQNTVEEWTITNGSTTAHPFHIHVNPFWVTSIVENGQEVPADDPRLNRWQDTVNIPPKSGDIPGSVTIRHRFQDFVGLFVIHCHILNHEDRGMMMNILLVENDETDPAAYFKKINDQNAAINKKINGMAVGH